MSAVILCFLLASSASLTGASLPPLFSNVVDVLEGGGGGGVLPNGGKLWAVLVAGSNGWFNYRHQADVCHAYQVLSAHGIPDEQIVVMMYDDIANNQQNPRKGEIINRPGGKDVYKGVPKDYTGASVTPETFLAVLKGENNVLTNGKKVVNTGPKDHIFVFFSDHGSPGAVYFPEGQPLTSKDFNDAIQEMHVNKRYGRMVLYIEACESGSMFNEGQLPNDIDVYATTASNATTHSYACYYDDELNTYLGDVYSVKWMQDSDSEDIEAETLEEQFRIVKKATTTSPVQEFGDLDMADMKVGDFQGLSGRKKVGKDLNGPQPKDPCLESAVPAPEVNRLLLRRAVERSNSIEDFTSAKKELDDYMKARKELKSLLKQIVLGATGGNEVATFKILSGPKPIKDNQCYSNLLKVFRETCPHAFKHDYVTRVVYALGNLCSLGHSAARTHSAMVRACQPEPTIVIR